MVSNLNKRSWYLFRQILHNRFFWTILNLSLDQLRPVSWHVIDFVFPTFAFCFPEIATILLFSSCLHVNSGANIAP